jgi:hypothetical protein
MNVNIRMRFENMDGLNAAFTEAAIFDTVGVRVEGDIDEAEVADEAVSEADKGIHRERIVSMRFVEPTITIDSMAEGFR